MDFLIKKVKSPKPQNPKTPKPHDSVKDFLDYLIDIIVLGFKGTGADEMISFRLLLILLNLDPLG